MSVVSFVLFFFLNLRCSIFSNCECVVLCGRRRPWRRAGSAAFTYTPSVNFVGTDRFTYSADDCNGNGLDEVYAGYNWTRTKCRVASATVEVIVRNPATLPAPLTGQVLAVAEDTANWTTSVMRREPV